MCFSHSLNVIVLLQLTSLIPCQFQGNICLCTNSVMTSFWLGRSFLIVVYFNASKVIFDITLIIFTLRPQHLSPWSIYEFLYSHIHTQVFFSMLLILIPTITTFTHIWVKSITLMLIRINVIIIEITIINCANAL